jgi:hypothetical protein
MQLVVAKNDPIFVGALDLATQKVSPLSHRERAGVRGSGLSLARTPSPGSLKRSDLFPMGEVK